MSGAGAVSYAVSAAERARMREFARQEQARRRWRMLQGRRAELAAWAASVAREYGQPAVAIPALAELASLAEPAVDEQVEAAMAETARLRAEVDRSVRVGRERLARELVRQVGQVSPRTSPGGAFRIEVPPPARSAPLAEASELFERLDSDVDPDRVRQLMADIGSAAPSRRAVLVAALRHQVSTLNRRARMRREAASVLAEVALAVGETGDSALQAALDRARATADAGDQVDFDRLRDEAKAAQHRHQRRREHEHVRRSLLEALARLDYQVVSDEELDPPPSAGVLIRQRGSSARHAVHLMVEDREIRFHTVRLVASDRPVGAPTEQERAEDLVAEQAWCRDLQQVLRTVSTDDIEVGSVARVATGTRPVRFPARGLEGQVREEREQERASRPARMQRELGLPG